MPLHALQGCLLRLHNQAPWPLQTYLLVLNFFLTKREETPMPRRLVGFQGIRISGYCCTVQCHSNG